MMILRKTLSAVLAVLMVASLCSVFSSAEEGPTVVGTDLATNWQAMSVKYSSKTDKAIEKTRDNTLFKFTQTEDDGIFVDMPTPKELAGVYPVAFLESQNKAKLDNLSVTFDLGDFDFTADGVGMSRTLSVTYTLNKIERIYYHDDLTEEGLYWGNYVYTNGLRHLLPEGKDSLGMAINITGYYWAEKLDNQIASSVAICTFDGESFNTRFDGRPGYRWVFIAKNNPETPNGDTSGISRPNEKLYCGEGLTIEFVPDTDHGYIVTINGKSYCDAKEVGYLPDQIAFGDGDVSKNIKDFTLADDVMLTQFVGKEGYLGIGGVGNSGSKNTNEDFTIKTVNNVPAAKWAGEDNTHKHTPGENETFIKPTCSTWGVDGVKCTECGAVVSYEIKEQLSATGLHDWSAWAGSKAATYTAKGEKSRVCSVCKAVETEEIAMKVNPFIDLPTDKWFSKACFWAYEHDYMSGVDATHFAPANKLNRAMFVQILAKVAGADLKSITYKNTFSDIPANKWYTNAVLWAVDNGITGGIGNGMFGPFNNVTRQQLATFFMAYANLIKRDTTGRADLSKYTDLNQVASWALNAMKWAVNEGIISGTSEKTLSPLNVATRQQVAVIFMAFVGTTD